VIPGFDGIEVAALWFYIAAGRKSLPPIFAFLVGVFLGILLGDTPRKTADKRSFSSHFLLIIN
jgi:hypothetical protein